MKGMEGTGGEEIAPVVQPLSFKVLKLPPPTGDHLTDASFWLQSV